MCVYVSVCVCVCVYVCVVCLNHHLDPLHSTGRTSSSSLSFSTAHSADSNSGSEDPLDGDPESTPLHLAASKVEGVLCVCVCVCVCVLCVLCVLCVVCVVCVCVCVLKTLFIIFPLSTGRYQHHSRAAENV